MEITTATVAHYAGLANLPFSEEERCLMAAQLGSILDYVARIAELDLADAPATTHIFPQQMTARGDETGPTLGAAAALANAPEVEGGHFLVPKVIKVK